MKSVAGEASGEVAAPVAEAFAALADLEAWPDWNADVRRVEILERDGEATVVLVEVRVLAVTTWFRARVVTDPPHELRLTRLPNEDGDRERLELVARLAADGPDACTVHVRVDAALDVPRFIPLPGGAGDGVAGGVARGLACLWSSTS